MLTKLWKLFKKLFKYTFFLIIITFILVHLIPLVLSWTGNIGFITFRGTYIDSINLPSHGNDEAIKVLDKFNEYCHNNCVKYKGFRPVWIKEANLNPIPKNYRTLGITFILPLYAMIFIDKTLPKEEFEHVLMHEYVHTFNIDHNDTVRHDLMNSFLDEPVSEESINYYSNYIRTHYYESN